MFGKHNIWGGSLEIVAEDHDGEESDDRNSGDIDRASYQHQYEPLSDEMKQGWSLRPADEKDKRKKKSATSVMCGCHFHYWGYHISDPYRHHRQVLRAPPRHHNRVTALDNYTQALKMALTFFNAQRSGKLPKNNNVSWRGDSCMKDCHLAGGYYYGGDATKQNFPAAFAMTMLSWSVLEYSEKYEAADLLDHVKDIIKWGTDYFLNTFNFSANLTSTHMIVSGVGNPREASNCWMRPEEISYQRHAPECSTCPALAAETAAALAAASIVFKNNVGYSKKLIRGANILSKFATNGQGEKYSGGADPYSTFYNSTGFWDEFLWGGTWMYFGTGNTSYLELVTSPGLYDRANSTKRKPQHGVLSWDNKLPGALLLLSRLRMYLNYGYPYEEMLRKFQSQIDDIMCSYLPDFNVFSRTKAVLIFLNRGSYRPLQHVANADFLAKLYGDYMESLYAHGIYCGNKFYGKEALQDFAKTQLNYILGQNPKRMSYVVGFGKKYPKQVHHMGASIPSNERYGCNGWKWRDSKEANPNVIFGAMVAGPDTYDGFKDVRSNSNYTEPRLAGNAGLVAALVALSEVTTMTGIDRNPIFYAVRPRRPRHLVDPE